LGSKELDKDEIPDVFSENPQLYFDYQKGKSMRNWSWLPMIVGGICFMPPAIISLTENGEYLAEAAKTTGVLGAIVLGGGIYLQIAGKNQIKNVASEYNRLQKQSNSSLGLVVGGNGIGLRLTF
jgi:hypothetical protein